MDDSTYYLLVDEPIERGEIVTSRGRREEAAQVDGYLHAEIQHAVQTSSRLYLLRDRLEPQKRGPPKEVLMAMRHYLSIPEDDDRIALTKLLVSGHPFALEQFCW